MCHLIWNTGKFWSIIIVKHEQRELCMQQLSACAEWIWKWIREPYLVSVSICLLYVTWIWYRYCSYSFRTQDGDAHLKCFLHVGCIAFICFSHQLHFNLFIYFTYWLKYSWFIVILLVSGVQYSDTVFLQFILH